MKRRVFTFLGVLLVLSMLLSACATQTAAPTSATTAAPASTTPAGLKITGDIETPTSWADTDLKAMKTMNADYTNKSGVKTTSTGVLINDLLNIAKPKADAATVVFVGSDGYTAEAALADVVKCPDCIVAFNSDGTYSTVMPTFAGKLQVKGVVEIQVK
jgi:molybdate transport system substrate-binding protein